MTVIGQAQVVVAAIDGGQPVDAEFVECVAGVLGTSVETVTMALRAALRAAGEPVPSLDMRTSGWVLDLKAATMKSIAAATLSTATLSLMSAEAVPVTVLSIIIPFLFEIDRVEVSAEDVWVHAHLKASAADESQSSLAELYTSLPADVQAELSTREFVGVVERLQEARLVSVTDGGVRVSDQGPTAGFWVSIR